MTLLAIVDGGDDNGDVDEDNYCHNWLKHT